jgi:hypothetical protein
MRKERVEIRGDKARPITLTGNCCAFLSYIDDFRRFVDSDHEASGTNQLGDQERCVTSAASKIKNPRATHYAKPMQDVLSKV